MTKRRQQVPGYGPDVTRIGGDPLSVGNNSDTLCAAQVYNKFNPAW